MKSPVNLFLKLIELSDVSAAGIFGSLMKCFKLHGFTNEYLCDNLVAVACDGGAVM